jgi:hypothetical protein
LKAGAAVTTIDRMGSFSPTLGRDSWVLANISNYDSLGLADLVKKKQVKPAELVEAAIERIAATISKSFHDLCVNDRGTLQSPIAQMPGTLVHS